MTIHQRCTRLNAGEVLETWPVRQPASAMTSRLTRVVLTDLECMTSAAQHCVYSGESCKVPAGLTFARQCDVADEPLLRVLQVSPSDNSVHFPMLCPACIVLHVVRCVACCTTRCHSPSVWHSASAAVVLMSAAVVLLPGCSMPQAGSGSMPPSAEAKLCSLLA